MDEAHDLRRAHAWRQTGSHVLAYASTPEGTEAHALFGTPDEICRTLEALQQVGVEYVIVTLLGGQRPVAALRARRDAGVPGLASAPMP